METCIVTLCRVSTKHRKHLKYLFLKLIISRNMNKNANSVIRLVLGTLRLPGMRKQRNGNASNVQENFRSVPMLKYQEAAPRKENNTNLPNTEQEARRDKGKSKHKNDNNGDSFWLWLNCVKNVLKSKKNRKGLFIKSYQYFWDVVFGSRIDKERAENCDENESYFDETYSYTDVFDVDESDIDESFNEDTSYRYSRRDDSKRDEYFKSEPREEDFVFRFSAKDFENNTFTEAHLYRD